eukprot:CAMPEP_0174268060 /NCGR_PEP_ID=MMETSP0439-20130205/36036_1 /TAXON_ID=0 /ORGANISM="Stereomyxa ramosa, Strain Chinc5" /LENGTH=293 /DNA_ID=CAMNT_0015355995 /DNA_START=145 /DNA_END=1026 /DNA_ORIENTATION=-
MQWITNFLCGCSPASISSGVSVDDLYESDLLQGEGLIQDPWQEEDYFQDEHIMTKTKTTVAKKPHNEKQIRKILGILENIRTQYNSMSTRDIVDEMRNVLETVKDTKGKTKNTNDQGELGSVVVVRNVLNWARTESVRDEKAMSDFMSHLILVLDDAQQKSLYTIFADLPPAVLGDTEAREETRVLVNIKKDIRDSQKLDTKKLTKLELVEVVTNVIVELVQMVCMQQDTINDQLFQLVSELLETVPDHQRARLVLEQGIMGYEQWLPSECEKRKGVLSGMFRDNNIVEYSSD